jgi:hypothetical protein
MRGLILGWTLLVLGATADPTPPEARTFRTYPLGYAEPAAIEAMAHAAIGEGGHVTIDAIGRRLMAWATAAEHAQLESLMRAVAVPPANIRVEVRFVGEDERSEFEASVGVEGDVVITPGGVEGGVRLRPRLRAESDRARDETRTAILVSHGRSGSLRVGETVPQADWLLHQALGWGLIAVEFQWQEVGAFLAVEPERIGTGADTRIRVRLTPELSGRVEGRPERIRFTRAATEVVVRPGEPMRLGGLGQDREFTRRFLAGIERGSRRAREDLWIVATLPDELPPEPPPPAL